MGACHNEGFKRRNSFSSNRERKKPSEKDSVSTETNDKKRGRTPNVKINNKNYRNKDYFTEKEIDINNKNKSQLDIISKIDKMSIFSENINNNKLDNFKKIDSFKGEIFFNKNVKNKKDNNNKIAYDYNLHTKFNNYGKKLEHPPIKIIQKFEENKNDNQLSEFEKLFDLKNNNSTNNYIYAIDDEPKNLENINNSYSNNIDYYNCIKQNLNNPIKLSNEILILPERNWYNELIDLSELLLETREKLDNRNFKIYLTKIIKIYEDFKWLIDCISYFYINLKNNNLQYNKDKIGFPDIKSDSWKKGFKWKGVFIKINEGDETKTIINEIKALNYFFFDYIQIIDKFQFIQKEQLSNMIIFPLIGYSIIKGKILLVSGLINIDNAHNENKNIIKQNSDILRLYSQIKSININDININKNNCFKNDGINLINSMGNKFYVDDLLISNLFYNLNESNFIKIKNNKYIIFNLHKYIPNLFEIKFDFINKINFFSKIKNKRIFYSLNYNTKDKTNIHKELSKYKNQKDVIENLYYINNINSLKKKDIIINNIHFRILYENEMQSLDDIKNNSPFLTNFEDNLFNYNYTKKNISIKTKIKEPYVIIYDLIEPIKLKYSLIKCNKNYVLNGKKDINDNLNKENDKLFYLKSNYLSHFMSWCKSLSQNSFYIKTYSDLKHNMNKYGINSILRFFSLITIDNSDITDIIKISFLVRGIKFIFDKENNQNNLNYNEEGIKFIIIKYIKSILYPSEILSKDKTQFEIIFKELVFYYNILFLKLKLIDYYLNLDLLSLIDIRDKKISKNIPSNFLEEKINLISKKLTGFNSPEEFLIHIISTARKKPFLFLCELEQKLNFVINPFIKFKSSLSIESMKNQLNMSHITINYNCKTYSYVKSNEIGGLILAKIINRYNSYELYGANLFNKDDEEKKVSNYNDDETSYNSRQTKITKNLVPSVGDNSINHPYIFIENNIMNNACEENLTNNSDISKEYAMSNNKLIPSNKNIQINNNNQKLQVDNNTNISSLNTTRKLSTNNNDYNKIEWDDIKKDFLFELPSICYKMNSIFDKNDTHINKFRNSSLYKNLSNIYYIINQKILCEWSEILEFMFSKVYSCDGETEHTLLYSLFYLFIITFFFEKKKDESKKILKKINYLYHNGGYKLSLNDLIIINLFYSLLNNNYIKSEENYSKCIMLILLAYGDPRGRNNDSHGILEFPLWNLCRKTLKFEQVIISENFREMFHTLDFFEWQKSLLREKNKLFKKNDIINYAYNVNENLDEIFLINNMDKFEFKNKENNNEFDEFKLNEKIFDENILELKKIKHFNFPKLSDFNDIENNMIENTEFLLFLIKNIQSLFIGKKIMLDENYINNEISNEIFNPNQNKKNTNHNLTKNNNNLIPKSNNIINFNLNKMNLKYYNNNFRYTNRNSSGKIPKNDINSIISNIKNNINNINRSKFNFSENNSKQFKRPLSGTNSIKYVNKGGSIFSNFLYKDLLEKLSYTKNMPSGVVFSFGNNRHCETSHDNLIKLTLPRIIFKLKNEYVDKIYAGWEHNIILNNKGEIFSFGHNKDFQCGLPNNKGSNQNINNPTNISIINDNMKAISASCGNEHTLILKDDNSVYAFGCNEDGELGLKDKNIKTYKPNKINFGKYSNQIIQISAGTVHNLALTKDGRVFAWGSSQGGQLGLPEDYLINQPDFKENFFINEPTIVHIDKNLKKNKMNNLQNIKNNLEIGDNDEFIIKIACGEAHSVALSNKGSVYSWGFGSNGQLGLGFCEDTFEPGYGTQLSRKFTPQYVKDLETDNIIDIHCGKTFSMFINNKNEILATGVNDLNQLGIIDNPQMKNNEIVCYDIIFPTRLDYLIEKKVIKLSCGEGHCVAIINYPENETVWSWGNNKFGQLGHGSWVPKSLPTPINYLLGFNNNKKIMFEEIACGGFHSLCLIKYRDDISWIEEDFKKIINVVNNKNFDIISTENNNRKIK